MAIALCGIFGKILDWVILLRRKVHYALHTYNLVSKKGCPQRSALIVLLYFSLALHVLNALENHYLK